MEISKELFKISTGDILGIYKAQGVAEPTRSVCAANSLQRTVGGGRGGGSYRCLVFISAKVLGLCDPLAPSLLASSCFELIMPASWCGWLYLGDIIFLVAELVRGLFCTWEPHKRHPCSMMDNILPPNVSFFVILLIPDSISCSRFFG